MTESKGVLAGRLARKGDDPEREETEEHGCYALLRGIRDRALMIEFLPLSGDSFAFAYADLSRVILLRNRQIELAFGAVIVTLHGENLRTMAGGVGLHAGLVRQRVPWVKAVDPLKAPVNADAAIVTRIDIEDALGRIKC